MHITMFIDLVIISKYQTHGSELCGQGKQPMRQPPRIFQTGS